jgi:peptidoglycan/LPS O-acetylase OafA/YrhL
MALGRFFVATVRGATLIVMESVTFAVSGTGDVLSVTWSVNVEWAGELGMPVMVPLGVRSNPAGREPSGSVHEYGRVPPDATRVAP